MSATKVVKPLQPRFWAMGFCCPYHGDTVVGLTTLAPGHLECSMCHRVFTQREHGLSFLISNEPEPKDDEE